MNAKKERNDKMYGIEKKNLISFIPQIGSIGDRIKNDIFGDGTIHIKEFKLNGNIYTIKGVITVTLSPVYKERTIFEIKAIASTNELVLKNIQYSKWENVNHNATKYNKPIIAGDKLKTTDLFAVHTKGDTNYLVHSVNNTVNEIYIVENDYSIKDGFNEELQPISADQLATSESFNPHTKPSKKLNLKALIRKIR